jgi:predicted esterase YcpF (UPF0227 family)
MEDIYQVVFNPETDMVKDPKPILQQQKAKLTTNPFIKKATEPIPEKEKDDVPKINRELSIHIIGFMDDMFDKPDSVEWHHHIKQCIQKENRMLYMIILLIFIILFIVLMF